MNTCSDGLATLRLRIHNSSFAGSEIWKFILVASILLIVRCELLSDAQQNLLSGLTKGWH